MARLDFKTLSLISVLIITCLTGAEIRQCRAQLTPTFETKPSPVQVNVGEDGRLLCLIKGGENQECYWNKNDASVDIKGRYAFTGNNSAGDCSILITNSSRSNDDGQWACGLETTSSKDGIKSESINYTVFQMPKDPVIFQDQDGSLVQSGPELHVSNWEDPPKIVCRCESGYPEATLQWTLQNENLTGTTNLTVDKENDVTTTVLYLTEPMDESWQDNHLICTARHPSYKDSTTRIASVAIKYSGNSENYENNKSTTHQVPIFVLMMVVFHNILMKILNM